MKKKALPFYKKVSFWFVIVNLIIIMLFAATEQSFEEMAPSDHWSIGIKAIEKLPNDERKITVVEKSSKEGLILFYVDDVSIHMVEMTYHGEQIQRKEWPISNAKSQKVLKMVESEDQYQVYLSDRKVLRRFDIDKMTHDLNDKGIISQHSKYFALSKDALVTGDDDVVEAYLDETLIGTYTDYDYLFRLEIESDDDYTFFTMDATDATYLVRVTDQLERVLISDKVTQETYGRMKDLVIQGDTVYILSNSYDRFNPSDPSRFALWKYDAKQLEFVNRQHFYHVATDLDPLLIKVDDDVPTYILGTMQKYDPYSGGLSKFQYTKGGTFVNVSRYSAKEGELIENTRMTLTRHYPMGYWYFESVDGPMTVWVDKVAVGGNLMISGEGEQWIKKANQVYRIDWKNLSSAVLTGVGNSIGWGTLFFIMIIAKQANWLIVALVTFGLLNKFLPLNDKQKEHFKFYGAVCLTIAFKAFLIMEPNSDFWYYGFVYPFLFGSFAKMLLLVVVTSLASYVLYWIWKKQHPYYVGAGMHFGVFLGFETYIMLFTVMMYLVSAMQKTKFLM